MERTPLLTKITRNTQLSKNQFGPSTMYTPQPKDDMLGSSGHSKRVSSFLGIRVKRSFDVCTSFGLKNAWIKMFGGSGGLC